MTGSISTFYSEGASNENYDHSSMTLLLHEILPLLACQRDKFIPQWDPTLTVNKFKHAVQ